LDKFFNEKALFFMKKNIFPKAFLFCLCLYITAFNEVEAQPKGYNYKTAIGVKFYPGAISIKHFIKKDAALEGLLYFWEHGFRITGLYEFHGNINGAPGLKWYVGPGAHIGFWNDRWRERYEDDYYRYRTYHGSYFGIDGVLGLDYKFKGAPINMSIDWQPSFNFGEGPHDYYGFYSGWGGFAIRYTIK